MEKRARLLLGVRMNYAPFSFMRRRRITAAALPVAERSDPLSICYRCVHERPFVEPPPEGDNNSDGEAYETARDALLQLNMMVRRGIEPDALMYTSLIATMGRARLEWQAYKLFSRMLESGIRPLPETYVALHDATSPRRHHLRCDLQQKIEESLETFPEELAEAELQLQRERDRLCVQKFEEYMSGVLPPAPPPPPSEQEAISVRDKKREGDRSSSFGGGSNAAGLGKSDAKPIATMHIRNPTDAWSTAQMMDEQQKLGNQRAQGSTAISLCEQLDKLHEEELRIFLSAQRQLRHGNKTDLVKRVLHCVSEKSIRDMLERRKHYFQSVAHILENDLNSLRRDGIIAENKADESVNNEGTDAIPSAANSGGSQPVIISYACGVDQTITAEEKESVAPDFLHTPWGILRKPVRHTSTGEKSRSIDRLQRLSLNVDELQLVRSKASTGDLDELPESLLRRYAYQFSLTWKRRHPLSLLEAVQWHSTTLLPQQLNEEGGASPTPALRRQQEDEGVHKTLENYEAFRIISQRTNNLQVVDNKEINLHLKAIRREALRKERRAEETLRREHSLLEAAALAASAKSFTPPEEDMVPSSRVLGVDAEHNNDNESSGRLLPTSSDWEKGESQEDEPKELPPWAIFNGEEEFNMTTGRFGDPRIGRYQELSDGRFKILPSREAQSRWTVNRQLLPGALQDTLQRAELQQKTRVEAVEKVHQEKLKFKRYRKWDAFLRKAQDKQKGKPQTDDKEGDGDGKKSAGPLPAKKRLSLLLRKGKDKAPIDDAVKAKYCKTL